MTLLLAAWHVAVSTQGSVSDTKGCVVIAATSDLHGAIEERRSTLPGTDVTVARGGLLTLSGYLANLRSHYGDRVLLLDGGDIYQGTLASNLSEGRAIIDAMNTLGYDAVAVGNHEFDFGGPPDGLGVFRDRVAQARFVFLAANMIQTSTRQPLPWKNLANSALFDKAGVRIGVIGIATPQTPEVTKPNHVASLSFSDPVAAIIKEAASLRRQGAQVLVMVGHVGGRCSSLEHPHDPSVCAPDEELNQILRALPQGTIDVAIGGHTHALVAHFIGGVAAIQAGAHGEKIAWVEACVDPASGLDRQKTRIVAPVDVCALHVEGGVCAASDTLKPTRAASFLGRKVSPNPSLVAAMRPYLQAVAKQRAAEVQIFLKQPMPRDLRLAQAGDNLGLAVARSMQEAVGADVGIQNYGGVRADLKAGALSYGDIYEVLPFDNVVVELVLTGEQLVAMVDNMKNRGEGAQAYLAGLSPDSRLKTKWRVGARALDPTRHYRVATNDFLVLGGAGLKDLMAQVPHQNKRFTSISMRDALIAHLQRRDPR